MKEREERLYNCLTQVGEGWIEEAAGGVKRRQAGANWGALAAALVLVAGLGWLSTQLGRNVGTTSATGEAPASSAGAAAPSDGTIWEGASSAPMAGGEAEDSSKNLNFQQEAEQLVLPLAVIGAAQGLEAERALTLDFSGWDEAEGLAEVRDCYVLRNTAASPVTCELSYPVAAGAEAALEGAGETGLDCREGVELLTARLELAPGESRVVTARWSCLGAEVEPGLWRYQVSAGEVGEGLLAGQTLALELPEGLYLAEDGLGLETGPARLEAGETYCISVARDG